MRGEGKGRRGERGRGEEGRGEEKGYGVSRERDRSSPSYLGECCEVVGEVRYEVHTRLRGNGHANSA